MEVLRLKNISIGIIAEMDKGEKKAVSQNIEKIYDEIEDLTNIKPKQDASYWAISILPPVPIHGGSSGNYSHLTENDIALISHEMFHWWNGSTLKTNEEVKWIKEGFTKYYEGKLILKTGIWSDDGFRWFIENTNEELFKGSNPQRINFITLSNNYSLIIVWKSIINYLVFSEDGCILYEKYSYQDYSALGYGIIAIWMYQ